MGPPQSTRRASYTTYSAVELRGLAKQCRQRLGESVPAWSLHPWEDGADTTELSPTELKQPASIAPGPHCGSDCTRTPQAGKQTLINGLMAAVKPVG